MAIEQLRDTVSRDQHVDAVLAVNERLEEARVEVRHAGALARDLVEVLNDAVRMEFHGAGLARAVIAALDRDRERTGVDEWDESDERCYLYNAAYAVVEGRDPREA